MLFSMSHVAKNREAYLDNYWAKNKRSVEKGRNGPTYAWHIPANQRRKADTADAINELLRQGLEIHKASAAFTAGSLNVAAGDYIVRGDQPFRTLADMYFSVQNYPAQNPSPYDDTGWTFPEAFGVQATRVTDPKVLDVAMEPVKGTPMPLQTGATGAGTVFAINYSAEIGRAHV